MILYNALPIGSEKVDQGALAKPLSNPTQDSYTNLDAPYWPECAGLTKDCNLESDKEDGSKVRLIWRIFQKPNSR